ncbi:PKD domain-containing protein, partial [Bacteroidia bacterium]|nr:PKD domain-containing protein [Bacteroidia bacterium]
CPLNAVSVRSFRVRVKPRAETERIIDTLPCGVYALKSDPIDGFKGNPSYQWTILDSNRNIIFDKKIAKFNSTGNFLSTKQTDTLLFRRGGTYIVQHDINNIPINCPTTYYDTIVVPPLLEANLTLGQDTFVCAGTDLVFEPYLSNTNPPVVYQWSTMGVTDDGEFLNNTTSNASDNKDTFLLSVQNVVYDTAVSIFITDASGCTSEDTVQVFLKANPLAVLPPDPRICSYDSIQIIPNLDTAYWVDPIAGDTLLQGDTLYKEWYFNGSLIPFSYDDSVTINMRGEYVIRVYDSLQCADTDTLFLWVNDTVTANAGPDQTLCAEDLYIISGNGLDTMVSGVSGFYRWSNITTSGATSILGFDKTYELTADMDSTYRLELTVTQEGVTCFDDDTTEIFVNSLPIVTLGSDQDVCCDYGDISLSFSIVTPTGNPSTGGWSCTSNPNLISSNVFNTSDACDLIAAPAKSIDINAVYTFMEPSTLCVQSDSILITVNSLPNLILQEQNYCQDIGSIRLDDDVVISPANTSLGSPSWICLDSNNNNFVGNILENRGSQFAPDYWLNIDETRYTIQNPDKDTLILEFRYTNEKGCKAVDTTSVIIWRVPKIVFNSNRDLCFDEGEIELDTLTSINISGGVWSCYDSLGFEPCAGNSLGGIVGDTINTLNSLNDNAAHTWMLRYYHIATGCPAENFIPITINPLPQPSIDPFVGNRTAFCETESDQPLTASPAGGIWTCDDPTALVGSAFSPGSGSVQAQDLSIYYNYTNPVTGCKNVDSTIGRIDPSPSLNTPNDTAFCRQMSQNTVDINYNITGTNHNGLSWFTNNAFGNQSRMSVSTHSDVADEILTLNLQNNSSDTFRIITAAAGLAACNAIDDFFDVIVNPIPDVRLTNSNPNGCNPVSSDFDVQFNNTVDPATSLYDWELGEGSTSTASAASATYNQDGQSTISVVVTSDKGCDTTINSTVDVYPIPVASFVPNPNNFTTAALPRFFFNNESVVDNILGSRIVSNEWDFGDLSSIIDTSTLENPPYVYPPDTGTYSVLLRVTTNFGCTDTFSYPVMIGPDLIVYVPNAFVPDGAGPEKNEGFHAIISGEKHMELIIFNRWGEIMFESIKKEEQWDGTY